MNRSLRNGWSAAALCIGLVAVGCASFYKVTDPQSGREYYTQEVEQEQGGAVKLKDARSGSIVTLHSSEVKEITDKEYAEGLAAAAKPAAVPAPTTVTTPAAPAPANAPSAAPAAAPAAVPDSAPSQAPASPAESK